MKLSLKSPVNPFWLTQVFGVNKQVYKRFNYEGHNGLDMLAIHGQPVYAAHDGVANYEVDNSQGHGVDIVSTETFDLGAHGVAYIKTRYWHLVDPAADPKFTSPIYGKKNVKVKAGDLIGYADNTGFSTGDHLHFGLKPLGKNSKNKLYNLFPNNGFGGAIDPFPFIEQPLPANTSVSYDTALALLQKAGLPKLVFSAAALILKRKYRV